MECGYVCVCDVGKNKFLSHQSAHPLCRCDVLHLGHITEREVLPSSKWQGFRNVLLLAFFLLFLLRFVAVKRRGRGRETKFHCFGGDLTVRSRREVLWFVQPERAPHGTSQGASFFLLKNFIPIYVFFWRKGHSRNGWKKSVWEGEDGIESKRNDGGVIWCIGYGQHRGWERIDNRMRI